MGESQPVSDQPVPDEPAANPTPNPPAPGSSKEKARRLVRVLRPFVFVVLIVLSFRSTIADWNDVPTGSMKPNILEGDRIFVNKLAYDLKVPFTTWHIAEWDNPERGEVVIFYSPADGMRLVKRVIGVPGDVLELRNNELLVNGKAADYEPLDAATRDEIAKQLGPRARDYELALESLGGQRHPMMKAPAFYNDHRTFGPITVPPGKYFMMGDNRDNSNDSRYYGVVDRSQIVGRASRVVVSVDPQRSYMPRWARFFAPLP
jgi:signal peptidase I